MHSGDYTHCMTLETYEDELSEDLLRIHGREYRDVVDAMITFFDQLIKIEERIVIKELGIMQGSSLATLIRNIPDKLIGIDITLDKIKPYIWLFQDYADKHDIEFELRETSSISDEAVKGECHILHIDSMHKASHLAKELALHNHTARGGIFMHDTNLPGMYEAVQNFLQKNDEWELLEHSTKNVGWTSIVRKSVKASLR